MNKRLLAMKRKKCFWNGNFKKIVEANKIWLNLLSIILLRLLFGMLREITLLQWYTICSHLYKLWFIHWARHHHRDHSLRLRGALFRPLSFIQLSLISLLLLIIQFISIIYRNKVWLINIYLGLSGYQVLIFILREITLYWELMIKRLFGLIWIWDLLLTKIWNTMIKQSDKFPTHTNTPYSQVAVMMVVWIYFMEWYSTIYSKMP